MTDTMDCPQARISLGVYVLGALEPAERAAVDAHLATCARCRAEHAEIEDLPALLASLSTDDAVALGDGWPQEPATPLTANDSAATPGSADRPADRSPAWVRRNAYRTTLLSVAAVLVIALGAVGAVEAGVHVGQASASPNAGPALGSWQSAQGSNTAHMHAIVRYRPMGWGTQVAVQVTGIPLRTMCVIEAYERNGATVIGGSWITDSNEGRIWYPASAAVSKDTVAKFVITVSGHPATAITIPI
jgi:hypothetical protein